MKNPDDFKDDLKQFNIDFADWIEEIFGKGKKLTTKDVLVDDNGAVYIKGFNESEPAFYVGRKSWL